MYSLENMERSLGIETPLSLLDPEYFKRFLPLDSGLVWVVNSL